MSHVLAMAKRLEEAEKTIERLQNAAGNDVESRSERVSAGSPHESHTRPEGSTSALSVPALVSQPDQNVAREPTRSDPTPDLEALPPDLSVDQNGRICFYGPTSAVHDPPDSGVPASPRSTFPANLDKNEMSAYLAMKNTDSRNWESFALKQAALQSAIPCQVIEKLLNIHWTWISPMFMWIYRPAFIRKCFVRNGTKLIRGTKPYSRHVRWRSLLF
jgi:hypothetical protein